MSDDIDWELIGRYLSGQATPAEAVQMRQWVEDAPENWALVAAARRIARTPVEPDTTEWKAVVLAALRKRRAEAEMGLESEGVVEPPRLEVIRRDEPPGPPPPPPPQVNASLPGKPSLPRSMKMIVVAALIGGAAAAGRFVLSPPVVATAAPRELPDLVLTTARGERLARRLVDGTRVMLAPGSTLRVPARYGEVDRAVSLDGQAEFTVTHDAARPFVVRTSRVLARDLGTRFVVRAYASEALTDVVVAEGRVAVARRQSVGGMRPSTTTLTDRPAADDTATLVRGDRARFVGDGRLALTRGVALDSYFGWAEDGLLVFRNSSLADAVVQFSRWYNVSIRLESTDIGARRVTASFKDEPASEALRVIAAVLALDLRQTDDGYTLRAK